MDHIRKENCWANDMLKKDITSIFFTHVWTVVSFFINIITIGNWLFLFIPIPIFFVAILSFKVSLSTPNTLVVLSSTQSKIQTQYFEKYLNVVVLMMLMMMYINKWTGAISTKVHYNKIPLLNVPFPKTVVLLRRPLFHTHTHTHTHTHLKIKLLSASVDQWVDNFIKYNDRWWCTLYGHWWHWSTTFVILPTLCAKEKHC